MTTLDQIRVQTSSPILVGIDVAQYSSELAALVFMSLNVDFVKTVQPIAGVCLGSHTRSLFLQILGTSLGSVYPKKTNTSFVMNVETNVDHRVNSVAVDYP